MIEPVSSILFGWTVGKVADALWTAAGSEIQSRFKKTDLTAAIEAGKQAVAGWEQPQPEPQRLFYHCPPKEAQDFLTEAFTHSSVQEELQRPLKQAGEPQVLILCVAFRDVAATKPTKLNAQALETWLQVFVRAYVAQTSYHINVRVAQQHYLTQLIDRLDDHRFLGMAVEGGEVDRVGKLVEIFVMPDVQEERWSPTGLRPSSRWAEELLLERQPQLQERRSRSPGDRSGRTFSAAQLITTQRRGRSVLLGDPGSGKTSLVSYFAVTLADAMQKQLQDAAMPLRSDTKALRRDTEGLRPGTMPLRPDTEGLRGDAIELRPNTTPLRPDAEGLQSYTEALLPILVKIRQWARHPDLSLLDYLRQFAEDSLCVKPLPADFFEYWLDRGQALILLDGLDEVADESKRYRIVEEIQSFLGKYPHSRAMITSRPAGYRSDFFRTEEFPHYELQRFDDDKMNEFIDRWYDSRIDDPQERQRRKESLRKALNDTDRTKLLARNPLLLTMIAMVAAGQPNKELPKQRHELYEAAVETLLRKWDLDGKGLKPEEKLRYLQHDDLLRLMEKLAYWIHTQDSTNDSEAGTLINREKLLKQITKDIQQLNQQLKSLQLYQARDEAKRFVDFVRERTGLLNEQGRDYYAFVHKTFQEYLTTKEIIYQYETEGEDFELVLRHIEEHLHDPHWREVLLLLIAQQATEKAALAICKILDANSPYEQWLHRDLLFAGWCLAENIKSLKAADAKLPSTILASLLELEVGNYDQIGVRIPSQVLKILCSLNETELETEALQLIKTKADTIGAFRLRSYRTALGEKSVVIAEQLHRLNDEDPNVRFNAVNELGRLGSATELVVQALSRQLDDEDLSTQGSVMMALSRLKDLPKSALQVLLHRLNDEDPNVRFNAAFALSQSNYVSEQVRQALLQQLSDDSENVRQNAVLCLSMLDDTSEPFIKVILQRLDDEDSLIQPNVAFALGKLSNLHESVVRTLLLRLESEKIKIRAKAAVALGELHNAPDFVLQALILRLNDDDSEVRENAAYALGRLRTSSESVVQALLQRLNDEKSRVRGSAISALGSLNNTSELVIQALLQQLEDKEIRSSAAAALGNLGKTNNSIQPLIIQWIEQHQDSENVGDAIDALWAIVEG